jgi:hypothetical protein
MPAHRVVIPAVAAVALLLAGCGGGGNESAAPSCDQPSGTSTQPQSGTAAGSDLTFLTGVQFEPQECVDRLTFDFRQDAGRPGYRVQYLPADRALIEDGSGNPVKVDGSAYLVVRLEPSVTADTSGDQLVFTYKGPRRIEATGGRDVREIVKSGDFEAVVTWVVGLGEKRPFKVTTTDSRLVVDVT